MHLLTPEIRERLLANGRIRHDWPVDDPEPDFFPVVKLFTPDAGCTWLLTEIDPDDEDIAFGLCDLGIGYPELGSVCLAKIGSLRGRLNLAVERDLHFVARKTLSVYAEDATLAGRIKA